MSPPRPMLRPRSRPAPQPMSRLPDSVGRWPDLAGRKQMDNEASFTATGQERSVEIDYYKAHFQTTLAGLAGREARATLRNSRMTGKARSRQIATEA